MAPKLHGADNDASYLAHRKILGNEFTKTNGNYCLSILVPSSIGLPYGTIPRLLLA